VRPRRRSACIISGGFPRQLPHRVPDLSAYATKMRVPLLRAERPGSVSTTPAAALATSVAVETATTKGALAAAERACGRSRWAARSHAFERDQGQTSGFCDHVIISRRFAIDGRALR
jgi:hypothetical protein